MAHRVLEKEEGDLNCEFCTQIFKSPLGLQYHIQKMYPLDVKSGLYFTCNKTFTKRYLIENHYKTVKHQLECKRLLQAERVEMTSTEYRKRLFQMNNFS